MLEHLSEVFQLGVGTMVHPMRKPPQYPPCLIKSQFRFNCYLSNVLSSNSSKLPTSTLHLTRGKKLFTTCQRFINESSFDYLSRNNQYITKCAIQKSSNAGCYLFQMMFRSMRRILNQFFGGTKKRSSSYAKTKTNR